MTPAFLNREFSWLAFNRRVLEEALDPANPLLERVKFLAISANNLDEFLEIRVAGMLQQIEEGAPAAPIEALAPALHKFADDQYQCWNHALMPELTRQRIDLVAYDALRPAEKKFATAFYAREVDPLLTPITVDPAHPFPRVLNKALCFAFLLRRKRRKSELQFGVLTVPRALPRLIRLPDGGSGDRFLFLADLIAAQAPALYRGFAIVASSAFRVTRNSNLYLQEEEARSLLETVRVELHNRRKGTAVRLEIEGSASPEIVERLRANFELEPWQVFSAPGPVNLSRLIRLYEMVARPELKYPVFKPAVSPALKAPGGMFAELRRNDRLLHHPYDSYAGVVRFLQAAAADPRVLSIKQTLYRTSIDSPILQALLAAAPQKEVAVVVELQARFDEVVNIRWARLLEDAGVQVSYGAVGRKTHGKMALVVRHDEDGALRRYLHLGTGNYNHRTARTYTDFSLLTAREDFAAAAQAVFTYLTTDADAAPSGNQFAPLLVAPTDLAAQIHLLIDREAEHARHGRPARIIAKVNGLLDQSFIESLYAASTAGVEIDLLVRGMCALRPGYRTLSRHIRVRSLVGRFLEHSRIYYFENGGAEEVYLGSADWMPRNLYERVEVVFPIADAGLRHRVRHEILAAYLADTAKTRWLTSTGNYRRPKLARRRFNAQEYFIARSLGQAGLADIPPPETAP
ncbi:MAG TPA: polyphosphate kinase 1 [Terriglobales bacterium]|nr:polyphosphate kinase 1 [Terriglobales bacterium]